MKPTSDIGRVSGKAGPDRAHKQGATKTVMAKSGSPRRSIWQGTALIGALMLLAPSTATGDCREDAMVVFDGSGSMAEMGFNDFDEPRIFEARRAVAKAIPEIARDRRLGLLVYGPNGADACSGIDLRFAPTEDAGPAIIGAVEALEPAGETPLTEAVRAATDVLRASSAGGTVVVVTDGKETCGGLPCQLAEDLSDAEFIVHVIGFKVRGEFFSWSDEKDSGYENAVTVSRCLADRTGGHYVGAENVDELIAALQKTLGCSLMF